MNYLAAQSLRAAGPVSFGTRIERMLLHLGFSGVENIDGSGDAGGDILALRGRELFVFQCKWTTGRSIDKSAVNEVEYAKARYGADRAVVVTNAAPDKAANARIAELARIGVRIEVWNGSHLGRLFEAMPERTPSRFRLRDYQEAAATAVRRDLAKQRRALLVLATGLGKTVVGGEIIRRHLSEHEGDDVLIVAHVKELVQQLERAMWRHLPKGVLTHVLTGDRKPADLRGVTCGTVESVLGAVYEGYRPGLVMVDETHHLAETGGFQRLLDETESALQFGVTATPWRGDKFDISERFGDASFSMGIAEGMARGYLAQVEYRLLVDDVDWDIVHRVSEKGYTVRQLNSQLFLPQRDEAIVDALLSVWRETRNPRAILFCRTIPHALAMADLLQKSSPMWRNAACLHNNLSKRDRQVVMTRFRQGHIPLLTAVDILNEGVDVPDVNIIGFLRVTHSRRIFVQQLGRGLRLRQGKSHVTVLDFVTDIRRVAAVIDLRRSLQSQPGASMESLVLPGGSTIQFDNENVGSLMDAWIRDAADVETAYDESRLNFPPPLGQA